MSHRPKSTGTNWADALAAAIADEQPPEGAIRSADLARKLFPHLTKTGSAVARLNDEYRARGLERKKFLGVFYYWPAR